MTTNIWRNDYNPFNKWKVLAWYDRMKAIKDGKFMAPVNIALDLNQGTEQSKLCGGYRCNFCMSNLEDSGKQAEVPVEILMKIPRFYHDWGVRSVCVAGHHSDPLMYSHKHLSSFLTECKKYGIEVGIVSNGRYYTDELSNAVVSTCKWSGWSVNCGLKETYQKITGMDKDNFAKVIQRMKRMATLANGHHIGYKFLITDDNYSEILDAIQLASRVGVRHFQIRPCELPSERSSTIDVDIVERQIKEGIEKYERPGKFEIFGIREKFTPDFMKKPPKRCIASPLGSTWKADGSVVICPDRRWSWDRPGMVMGNFITDGLESIREKWGGPDHIRMIEVANESLSDCIRCTAYSWNEIYENVVEKDNMDVSLI